MLVAVYADQVSAARVVTAVDACRAPAGTEVLRLPNGRTATRPAKPWADTIQLRDGTWCVPWKERLRAYGGTVIDVGGSPTTVPRDTDCVVKGDADREDTR